MVARIRFSALGDPCNCRWIPVGLLAAQVKLCPCFRPRQHISFLSLYGVSLHVQSIQFGIDWTIFLVHGLQQLTVVAGQRVSLTQSHPVSPALTPHLTLSIVHSPSLTQVARPLSGHHPFPHQAKLSYLLGLANDAGLKYG